MQLSRQVLSYAGGLPLALEVLGSYLCGVESKEEWVSALERFKKISCEEVHFRLKISYDALPEVEKAMFLDSACFLAGKNKELAIDIWKSCGFYPEIGLQKLIQKSLVRIGSFNELIMHNQLRDMGRRIVYEESPTEPGKRSRLWSCEEVMEGTKKVQGLCLHSRPELRQRVRVKDFASMINLRFLLVDGINLKGNIELLPKRLRWLCWRKCPLKILQSDFYLEKLVGLDLSYSDIEQAWNNDLQNKQFENLEVLDLSHCSHLSESPDFSNFPQLEKLIVEKCTALPDVHKSIRKLKRLVFLNLSGCIKLMKLPSGFCTLHSLQELNLSGCYILKKLPKSIGSLTSLAELKLDHTQIYILPKSIENLWRLRLLSLRYCRSLTRLCGSIGKIESLVELYLDHTFIVELPDSIGRLEKLEILCVQHCLYLEALPKLPSSLICLDAQGCVSLKRLANLSNMTNLRRLLLINCESLAEIEGLEGAKSLEDLDVSGCINLVYTPVEVHVKDNLNNQPFSFRETQQSYEIGDLPEQVETSSKTMDFFSKPDVDDDESYPLPNTEERKHMESTLKRRRHGKKV